MYIIIQYEYNRVKSKFSSAVSHPQDCSKHFTHIHQFNRTPSWFLWETIMQATINE